MQRDAVSLSSGKFAEPADEVGVVVVVGEGLVDSDRVEVVGACRMP